MKIENIKKNFICLFIALSMICTNLCCGLQNFKVNAQEKEEMPIELKNKLNFATPLYYDNGYRVEADFKTSAMHKGIAYAFRENSRYNALIAFDLYGHQIWKYDIKEVRKCNNLPNFVFDEKDSVYFTVGGYVYAVNSNGTGKWKKKFEGSVLDNILLKDNKIIINITNEKEEAFTYALDKETGEIIWEFKVPNGYIYNWRAPFIALAKDGTILSYACNNWKNEKGVLYAIDLNGKEKWKYEYAGSNGTALLGNSEEEVYVTDNLNEIKVLDIEDGNIIKDNSLNGYSNKNEKAKNMYVSNWEFGGDNSLHMAFSSRDYKNKYKIIDSKGNTKFEKDKFMFPQVIDKEGYGYIVERKGGGQTIIVIDPKGKEVFNIPPIGGSASPEYKKLYVEEDILLGARTHSTDVLGFKIIRKGIEPKANSIEIVEKNKVLNLLIKNTLAVVVRDEKGRAMLGEELQWTSSDPTIASVDKKGEILPLKEGEVTLTAAINGTNISDSTKVKIEKGESIPTTIEIEPKEAEIELLKPYKFKAIVKDQLGNVMPDVKVNWKCNINYTNVMDDEGNIIPTQAGEYNVNASCKGYPKATSYVKIKVVKQPIKMKNIYPMESVLRKGESIQLFPIDQYGEEIKDGSFTWESLNDEIAEVDENGKVTAKAKGKAGIKVTDNKDKAIEFTKEVSVVDSFANSWSSEDLFSGKKLINGNANIYLAGSERILALNKEGKQQWKKDFKNIKNFIMDNDGNVYTANNDYDEEVAKVTLVEYNGNIKWQKDFKTTSYNSDIKQGKDGTIYLLTGKDLYALGEDGSQKWVKKLEAEGETLILDNDNIVVDCRQSAKKVLILDTKGDKLNEIGLDDKLLAFKNNTAYYFNEDRVNGGYSLYAKTKDGIVWSFQLKDKDEKYDIFNNEKDIDINNKGNIYFITKLKGNAIVYCLDNKGKLIWKKDFNNLVTGKIRYKQTGDLALDGQGNAYIALSKEEKKGAYNYNTLSNNIFKIDNKGNIEGYVSYDKESFDKFGCISIDEKDGKIYTTSDKKVAAFSISGEIKPYVNSITITAPSKSMPIDGEIKLTAVVKNQLGADMPNEKVKWTSSNVEIASIDENGLVKGLKEGEVDITAISVTDDKVKQVYNVKVVETSKFTLSKEEVKNKTDKVIAYYKKQGIPQGDWVAFALDAAGEDITKPPYTKFGRGYIEALQDNLSGKNELEAITEYERISLGILSGRRDPHNFAGMNLIEKIYNYRDLSQGNNAALWALIVYDAAASEIPKDAKYTREALIKHLLKNKSGDGWTVGVGNPDVDMTSMVLYALAPYKDREDVKPHIEKAIKWLKAQQLENGGFGGWGSEINPESTSQAIMALTACGIDPQSKEFTKSGGNPVTAMLDYQLPDGSFEHIKDGGTDEGFATPQGLQALAALKDFYENGVSKIFYHIPYNKNDRTETPDKKLMQKVNDTIEGLSKKVIDSGYKWGSALPLARAGKDNSISKDYMKSISDYLDEVYDTNKEDFKTYSETVVELLAAGKNPKDFANTNLVERVYNAYEGQSLETMALMLIAVDSGEYKEIEKARWTREKLINSIINSLEYSKKSNEEIDTDDLGLVLTALAPYTKENSDAKNTVDKIVKYLSDIQEADGSFATWNMVNARTCAEVIIGLCVNGIDPTSGEFTKNDKNIIDALLSFRAEDGGFAHVKDNISIKSGELDTLKGLSALAQYKYFVQEKGSIYNCGDRNSDSEASKSLRVRRVELGSSSITIKLEEEIKLEVKVIPEDALNKKLIWKSNDENVATVDENGLVKGIDKGKTEIIVTSEDGEKTAKCLVEVVKKIEKDELIQEVEEAIQSAGDAALENYNSMDWVVIGLARGKQAWKIDNRTYYENLENYLKENKGEFPNKPTEYERMTLGILATGGDPTEIAGYNLIEKIYNGALDAQGINAYIFGLIALDAGEYKIPQGAKWDREKIINAILKAECSNKENSYGKKGGWAYRGYNADADITGMAMTALAPYNNDKYPEVQKAVKRAVDWLKFAQQEDGGYKSWGSVNAESCAQVIMGLCVNGIDPTGEEFTKPKGNVVEALLRFKTEDGGFAHVKDYDVAANGMSTEQALYALAQYIYFKDGKGSIYHWGDMNPEEPEKPEEPGESQNFKVEIVEKENFKLGEKAKVEIKVRNKGNKGNMATLIAALYNKDTKEMENYSFVSKKVKENETENMSAGFVIPEKGNYEVKAFIWDDLVSINVLSEAINLEVK